MLKTINIKKFRYFYAKLIDMEKVFVVFNTACIGDILVTNTLVRNIKNYYPDSKVVFVCDSPYSAVARYQEGVDDVVTYDKKLIKSFSGFINFVKGFPYKKPFAAMVTYSNERNLLISRLIGAKHIISNHRCKLWNTNEKYRMGDYVHMKDIWGGLIEPLVGEHKNLPIKYCPPIVDSPVVNMVKELKNPVVLCTTSNFYKKDMGVNDCKKLIELMKEEGLTPVLTGAGKIAEKFSADLRKSGCFDFVDLVGCTSFPELANVLSICGKCITVDTGTLHFANALQVPVVGIFYAGCDDMWASDESLYPAKTLVGENVLPGEIMKAYRELTNEVCAVL